MDNNTLIYIVGAIVGGLIIGGIIGYLLAIRKSADGENRAIRFETRAIEFQKQIGEKDIIISRLNDQITRAQQDRIVAENAKTEAETKLNEVRADLQEAREEIEAKELERASYRDKAIAAGEKSAELDATNKAIIQQLAEQKQFLADADVKLRETFESLSSEALRRNNATFLESAKETLDAKVKESELDLDARKLAIETLVKPLGDSLKHFDAKLQDIEVKREGAYKGMETLLELMKGSTEQLDLGTKQLVNALKSSTVRGRYGEIGLKKIVEAAGMMKHCHFVEQETLATEEGNQRPDMTVRLPGHRELVLDSKVPLNAYLRAFETDDDVEQAAAMKAHAMAVKGHVKKLGDKTYWNKYSESPDFVIMYMHIESSYGAALMADPDLITDALKHNIVFATPSTLIGMLRTVSFMWQQEKMAESILQLRDAGMELYKRTTVMLNHFVKVGSGLQTAVDSYNKSVGSFERNVITQLVRFKEIGGTLAKEEMPAIKHIDTTIRPVTKSLGQMEDEDIIDITP